MSFNGSGTFNINTAGQPVVTGTTITSTAFNLLTSDLATGLSTCLTKDGQTTPTANIPMGGFDITGAGSVFATSTGLGTDASFVATTGASNNPVGISLVASQAPANTGIWTMATASSGSAAGLSISAVSDANAVVQTAMLISRNSNGTINTVNFYPRNFFSITDGVGANQVFKVDVSASSVATGIQVTGAAAAAGAAISVISTGTNEALKIDAKGSGTITLGGTSTGNIVLSRTATVGDVNLTGTNKVLGFATPGWSGGATAYLQAGVNANATGAGDYLTFNTPSGKGLSWTVNNSSVLSAAGTLVTVGSGVNLQLGNAYVATPQVSSGYVTIVDSLGSTYKVLVAA